MVATPIGNLKDMTYRGVEVLQGVDVIACEDTKQSGKLLKYYGIRKPLISCRARNEKQSAPGILKLLDEGKDVAYISDAGTPCVSDPGGLVVDHARKGGHRVLPLPGASALTALLSVSPFPGKACFFGGFLPVKGGRRKKELYTLLNREEKVILYESPYRVLKLLSDLEEIAPERGVFLAREMTKEFEEFLTGAPGELRAELEGRAVLKGEFTVLISAKKKG